MEPQEPDLPKKISFFNPKNSKIIILGVFVVLLVGVTIFSNIYGKLSNDKENVGNAGTLPTGIYPSVGVINPTTEPKTNAANEAPIILLSNYLNLLRQGDIPEAQKLFSEYSLQDTFQTFENEISNDNNSIKISYVSLKYSQQENFAYVTVETTNSGTKNYYRFTLIKLNSDWKIFSVERV